MGKKLPRKGMSDRVFSRLEIFEIARKNEKNFLKEIFAKEILFGILRDKNFIFLRLSTKKTFRSGHSINLFL